MRLLFLILAVAGIFLLLTARKETLRKHSTRFLESCLSVGTDLEFHVGKISSNGLGFIKFQNVEVSEPWLPKEQSTLFRAKEIGFRYNALDFFSKKLRSKVTVTVVDPELHWRPGIPRLRKPTFPIVALVRQWAMTERENLSIRVKGLTLYLDTANRSFKNIDFLFERGSFEIKWPVAHLDVGGVDLSSLVHIQGGVDRGPDPSTAFLAGQIRTEGSVVNRKPMPVESTLDFVFSEDFFQARSSHFLGEMDAEVRFEFTRDILMTAKVRCEQYPISNLQPFFNVDPHLTVPGHLDFSIQLSGSPWSPRLESRFLVYKGWVNQRNFKAMDIHLEGVVPTLRLFDSRILLEDGSTMRFADKTLELNDVFKARTYSALVREAQQDSVAMGDWQFSRPKDINDKPEFLMERILDDNTSIHFRKFNEIRQPYDASESQKMEVGLDVQLLNSKDFLKLGLREDEEFVGVERKVRF